MSSKVKCVCPEGNLCLVGTGIVKLKMWKYKHLPLVPSLKEEVKNNKARYYNRACFSSSS